MKFPDLTIVDDTETLPDLPGWITSSRAETPENVVFLSGAALAYLHLVLARDEVPRCLLRDRLALQAAEACMAVSGRPERMDDLRDALHLLRPGDLAGPAGETYQCWRRMVERPVSVKAVHKALPGVPVIGCGAVHQRDLPLPLRQARSQAYCGQMEWDGTAVSGREAQRNRRSDMKAKAVWRFAAALEEIKLTGLGT